MDQAGSLPHALTLSARTGNVNLFVEDGGDAGMVRNCDRPFVEVRRLLLDLAIQARGIDPVLRQCDGPNDEGTRDDLFGRTNNTVSHR